jgi:hypothetical protein
MDDQSGSWLKGCAIGCGALVLLVAGLSAIGLFRVLRPLQSAIDTRVELESRYGTEDSFTPPPDGTVDSGRIEAFLAVRSALADACEVLTANTAAMARMEELDHQVHPSRKEVWRHAAAATRSAFKMGPLIGDLFERRNEALLASGMGLGEYSCLYVIAYNAQLSSDRPRSGILDGSPVNRRVHRVLEAMLARQLEAARSAELDDDWIASLEREHAAMASDVTRIPWQDGLPEPSKHSLAPFQQELDATFCPAATEIELLRNVRRGLAIESE